MFGFYTVAHRLLSVNCFGPNQQPFHRNERMFTEVPGHHLHLP